MLCYRMETNQVKAVVKRGKVVVKSEDSANQKNSASWCCFLK